MMPHVFFRTFKKDCGALINLCASEDGQALVVTGFIDDHNHDINQVSDVLMDLFKISFIRHYFVSYHNKENFQPRKKTRQKN